MIIKIRTLRKPLYLGFILVLIIKYSWLYGGGVYFNNHRWVLYFQMKILIGTESITALSGCAFNEMASWSLAFW